GFKGHVWLPAGKSGLWFTEDGGATFKQIDTTKVQVADVIGFGKAASGASYPAVYITGKVANKTGIFMSKDQGETWQRINDDAHQYGSINYAITGDMRQYGIVFVGTNGRGVVYGTATGTRSVYKNQKMMMTKHLIRNVKTIRLHGSDQLKLYDLTGSLVRTSRTVEGYSCIDLTGLSKGLYFAKWNGNTETVVIHR
ncbi:MAG: hypothetical protein GX639_06660, partial [Fibrobacter sp.]|nr:hypothetical protein [Fibrobacter sp.]